MLNKATTVLVVEPAFSGHRFGYLEWTVDALLSAGNSVIVATDTANSKDARLHRLREKADVEIYFHDRENHKNILQKIPHYNDYHWIKSACRCLLKTKKTSINAIFLPYLDYVCYLSPLFGHISRCIPVSGILMTPYFHLPIEGGIKTRLTCHIKKLIFERFLQNAAIAKPFTIDSLLAEKYSKQKKPLRYIQDPSSFVLTANSITTAAVKKRILVYGSIAMRKGIAQLLEAYLSSDLQKTLSITIAGKQDKASQQYLQELISSYPALSDDLTIYNRFISAEEEISLFQAADIVWVGYVNFYNMSGVIVQAGMAHKPTLTSKLGLIGELTKRHELGIAVDVNNRVEVAKGLRALCDTELSRQRGENGYNRFKNHTTAAFMEAITQAMRFNSIGTN